MKKLLLKLGNLIAILLMFGPLIIASFIRKLKSVDFFFLLTCTILYDIYMYSVILKSNYIDGLKKRYEQMKPEKILNIKVSDKERIKIYENFIEEIINELK